MVLYKKSEFTKQTDWLIGFKAFKIVKKDNTNVLYLIKCQVLLDKMLNLKVIYVEKLTIKKDVDKIILTIIIHKSWIQKLESSIACQDYI